MVCLINKTYSDWFHVTTPTGVRQGGDLLPDFYSLNENHLFVILQANRIRWYVATLAAALMYADELVVLAFTLFDSHKRIMHQQIQTLNRKSATSSKF